MKAIFLLLLAAIASCSDGPAVNRPPSRNRSEADATAIAKVMPRGWVTDDAGLLNPAQEASLTARLQAFEKVSGHQLVVVTVRSLGGQDVAMFARELGKTWGVGRVGYNDGIVLLVAPNERKARIEIGLGLERALPNGLCQTIMNTKIIPHFRKGDFPGGIQAGVTALISHAS